MSLIQVDALLLYAAFVLVLALEVRRAAFKKDAAPRPGLLQGLTAVTVAAAVAVTLLRIITAAY